MRILMNRRDPLLDHLAIGTNHRQAKMASRNSSVAKLSINAPGDPPSLLRLFDTGALDVK